MGHGVDGVAFVGSDEAVVGALEPWPSVLAVCQVADGVGQPAQASPLDSCALPPEVTALLVSVRVDGE